MAMSCDSSLYQPPSSNWMAGKSGWPVPSITVTRRLGTRWPPHELVRDALLVERLLHPPARAELPRGSAAVQLHAHATPRISGHSPYAPRVLPLRSPCVTAGQAAWPGCSTARSTSSYEVGVDGDRRRGSGAGRGDDLGARIGHVAGGPDTGGAGPAGGVDSDEAGLVELATQPGSRPSACGTLPGRMNTAVRATI